MPSVAEAGGARTNDNEIELASHSLLELAHSPGSVSIEDTPGDFGAVALKPVFSEITFAIASAVVLDGS